MWHTLLEKKMNRRITYPEDHPFYKNDPDLDWVNEEGNFVVVIDTKTGIAYTGNCRNTGGWLLRDVETFLGIKFK